MTLGEESGLLAAHFVLWRGYQALYDKRIRALTAARHPLRKPNYEAISDSTRRLILPRYMAAT
uniref:Uncharacterized protein n=1 Tax=Bionectria ochroleuca TaxID=29856 RepID=A0A0B7K014_BIOOC